jgi:hypothetical protein
MSVKRIAAKTAAMVGGFAVATPIFDFLNFHIFNMSMEEGGLVGLAVGTAIFATNRINGTHKEQPAQSAGYTAIDAPRPSSWTGKAWQGVARVMGKA